MIIRLMAFLHSCYFGSYWWIYIVQKHQSILIFSIKVNSISFNIIIRKMNRSILRPIQCYNIAQRNSWKNLHSNIYNMQRRMKIDLSLFIPLLGNKQFYQNIFFLTKQILNLVYTFTLCPVSSYLKIPFTMIYGTLFVYIMYYISERFMVNVSLEISWSLLHETLRFHGNQYLQIAIIGFAIKYVSAKTHMTSKILKSFFKVFNSLLHIQIDVSLIFNGSKLKFVSPLGTMKCYWKRCKLHLFNMKNIAERIILRDTFLYNYWNSYKLNLQACAISFLTQPPAQNMTESFSVRLATVVSMVLRGLGLAEEPELYLWILENSLGTQRVSRKWILIRSPFETFQYNNSHFEIIS